MKNDMSYRDNPLYEPISRLSSPPLPNDYDADDENTLNLDPGDFVLPNGQVILEPSVLQHIEDARKLLNRLDVARDDPASSTWSTASADVKSVNRAKNPGFLFAASRKTENTNFASNIKVAFGIQRKMEDLIKEDYESDSPFQMSDSSGALDTVTRGSFAATNTRNPNAENEFTDDPETRIKYLEEIIKTKDEDIAMLKEMNQKHLKMIRSLLLTRGETEIKDSIFEGLTFRKQDLISPKPRKDSMAKKERIARPRKTRVSKRSMKKDSYPTIGALKNPYFSKKTEPNLFFREKSGSFFPNSGSSFDQLKTGFEGNEQESSILIKRAANTKVKKRKAVPKEDETMGMGEAKSPMNKRLKGNKKVSWFDEPSASSLRLGTSPDAPGKIFKTRLISPAAKAYAHTAGAESRAQPMKDAMVMDEVSVDIGVRSDGNKKFVLEEGDFWTSPNHVQPDIEIGMSPFTRTPILSQRISADENESRAQRSKTEDTMSFMMTF